MCSFRDDLADGCPALLAANTMALCIEVTEEMKRSFRADGFATSAGPVVAEPQLAVMRAACESHPATTFQGSATDCLWVADDELYGGHAWYGEKKGLVQFFGAGKLAVGYQALITDELHEACITAAVALLEALDGLHPAGVQRSGVHGGAAELAPDHGLHLQAGENVRVHRVPPGRSLHTVGGGAAGSDRITSAASNRSGKNAPSNPHHNAIYGTLTGICWGLGHRLHVLRAGLALDPRP